MYGMIATWRMSLEGMQGVREHLEKNGLIDEALVRAISDVEDFPYYKSVGYGGLPNEEMVVELDAGFMDGNSLSVGAVGAIKDFANPIKIAHQLSKEDMNNILVGSGAEKYAHLHDFDRKNMLTDRAKIHYANKKKELELAAAKSGELKPYRGHDTVGMVGIDKTGTMAAGTSTSGLFLKKSGRIGDSPIVGSGFYADSFVGAATATGLGEDLMKGVISYDIVRNMKEGLSAQEACEKAVNNLENRLKKHIGYSRDISVVAMKNDGTYGAASNIEGFSFVVMTEKLEPTVYLVERDGEKHNHVEATEEWMENYMTTRKAPLNLIYPKH